MTVQKFGGAVLRTPEGFRDMISIISRPGSRSGAVVVSAIGTSTRRLAEAAKLASQGALEAAQQKLQQLLDVHQELAGELVSDRHEQRLLRHRLSELCAQTGRLLHSVALTRQCSARTLDRIIAVGEDLSRCLACAALTSAGIEALDIDARDLIVTDSEFGMASPLPELTRQRVKHVLGTLQATPRVVVTQGFVAASEHGETTTMGRESSNLTASLLASCLDASDVTIWTDVDGVRTADPSMLTHTSAVGHLNYDQARCAADYGLKLLYPTMIEPALVAGIPIRVAMASRPDLPGTVIDAREGATRAMICDRTHDGMAMITALFAPLSEALMAAKTVVDELGPTLEQDAINVHTNAHDRAVTIVITPHAAPDVVRILHRELCETKP